MTKNKDFMNPTVEKTIGTVAGTAHYVKTEIEDTLGRWNDNYYTKDGFWVIHDGKQHHVYRVSPKGKGWHENPDHTGKAPIHKKVAERAQAKHAQNTPMKKKETKQKDIVFLNYDIMEFIKAIEEEEGINLNSKQRTDLYSYAIDNRFADDLEAYQFAIIIRLWAKGKWHPDWHPNNLKNIHEELPQEIKEIKAHMQRVKELQAPTEKHAPPYRVDVWEERDRLIITVYDANDKEVASWVDDDARQMFEDGFFDSKDLEQSVLEYLKYLKVIKGGY